MTPRPRGLVVDNDPKLAERVKSILNLGFGRFQWEVDWKVSHSALDACQLVLQQTVPFDFAIVDYDLGPDENALSVVQELRKADSGCHIVVITGEPSTNPKFAELSKREGADHAIIRSRLNLDPSDGSNPDDDWDGFSLARRLRRHMMVQDRTEGPKVTFADHIGVQSMLHSLGDPPGANEDAISRGKKVARTLILECLERENDAGATLHVDHLAPGRSGAYVCKVRRSQAASGQPDETFVIKISLDRASLDAEQSANERASRVLAPQVLIKFIGGLRSDRGSGYSALAAHLAQDAVTLSSWLRDPATTAAQAQNVADELFGGYLANLFQPSLRHEEPLSHWMNTSPIHKLRLHEALSAYAEAWAHPSGANQPHAKELVAILRDYVDSGALPGVDAPMLDKHVMFVNAFGDLHSKNVLVQTVSQPRPVLVDASRYGAHHWATDAARLLVDLILRVRRPGVESMLWSSLADQYDYCVSPLCHCSSITAEEPAPGPVDAFIAQVVANRRNYLRLKELGLRDAIWHWQWHVALGREFLRQGSSPDMAPPRTILALASAARHLAIAASALDDQVSH